MKYLFCLSLIFFVCCQSLKPEQTAVEPEPEIISLLGVKFFAPTEANSKLDSNLAVARKNFETDPSEENYIWLGRRTAYLTHYNEAIKIFSEGIDNRLSIQLILLLASFGVTVRANRLIIGFTGTEKEIT